MVLEYLPRFALVQNHKFCKSLYTSTIVRIWAIFYKSPFIIVKTMIKPSLHHHEPPLTMIKPSLTMNRISFLINPSKSPSVGAGFVPGTRYTRWWRTDPRAVVRLSEGGSCRRKCREDLQKMEKPWNTIEKT